MYCAEIGHTTDMQWDVIRHQRRYGPLRAATGRYGPLRGFWLTVGPGSATGRYGPLQAATGRYGPLVGVLLKGKK